jgi:hypothetical protein
MRQPGQPATHQGTAKGTTAVHYQDPPAAGRFQGLTHQGVVLEHSEGFNGTREPANPPVLPKEWLRNLNQLGEGIAKIGGGELH